MSHWGKQGLLERILWTYKKTDIRYVYKLFLRPGEEQSRISTGSLGKHIYFLIRISPVCLFPSDSNDQPQTFGQNEVFSYFSYTLSDQSVTEENLQLLRASSPLSRRYLVSYPELATHRRFHIFTFLSYMVGLSVLSFS